MNHLKILLLGMFKLYDSLLVAGNAWFLLSNNGDTEHRPPDIVQVRQFLIRRDGVNEMFPLH